jgi:DNA-binding response OmpR family regulator
MHKILVVDDEQDLCEILQFNLETEGYDVEVAVLLYSMNPLSRMMKVA